MIKIAIIAQDSCYGSSLHGLVDLFVVANAYIKKATRNNDALFEWSFYSCGTEHITSSNGLTMSLPKIPANEKFDVIFIPGILYQGVKLFTDMLTKQSKFYSWLINQHEQGSYICANCTSTFYLAESGLLDNKKSTTVWWLESLFKKRYKHIDLKFDQIIVEQDNIISAGAATSHFQLGLHLLKKFAAPQIVDQTAKAMLIDTRKVSSPTDQLLSVARDHNNALVHKAQDWIEQNISTAFTLADLASKIATTERTLTRQFNNTLSITPSKYITNLRVNNAKYLLESSDFSLDSIIEQVGYSDRSGFSKAFTRIIGIPPISYRRQFI